MRRLIVLLVFMVLSVSICYADVGFRVEDYTHDELAEIYSMISMELNDCIVAPAGFYVVGKDLPAGRYTVLKNDELPGEEPEFSWVAIFETVDEYKAETSYWSWDEEDTKALNMCNTLWNGMTIELKDGMVLAVGFGTAGIRKVPSGLFDALWD